MGRRLQKGFGEVPMVINGQTEIVKVGCEMVTIDGFSGHSDRRQLLEFVDQLHPKPGTSSVTTVTITSVTNLVIPYLSDTNVELMRQES